MPKQPEPKKKKDPRTTPQLYEQALIDEINEIRLPEHKASEVEELDEDGDPIEYNTELDDVDAEKKLIHIIGKKFALKYREYGPFDPEKVDEVGDKLLKFPFFYKHFEDRNLQTLKNIALSDTTAAEKEIRQKIVDTSKLPTDSWWPISVNARDYTESIQQKLRSKKFANMEIEEQLDAYYKILATRTSVDAVRGSFRGRSLDKDIDHGIYCQTMKMLDGEDNAVEDALKNMIRREGKEAVRDWACDGHGGLLEEKVKEEVRNMAKEGNFMLGQMPQRYRPTVKERLEDIRDVLQDNEKWSAMSMEQKKFLVSEYALLQKDARQPGGMNAVLGDINEHNKEAQDFVKSGKFDVAVKSVDQVRLNLAALDLKDAITSFRHGQNLEGQEEPKREPEGQKLPEGEVKKEEKKVVLPTA